MTVTSTLSPALRDGMDAYWRATNYLAVGQIYLFDNPLPERPLALADVKPMLLGHWGTTPGQNFIYVHLNRVIKKYDLDVIYVSGPGGPCWRPTGRCSWRATCSERLCVSPMIAPRARSVSSYSVIDHV